MAEQVTTKSATVPKPDRPVLPKEYGIPTHKKDLLSWEWVVERLEKARNYWVCTASTDGRPHAMPVWAFWVDNALYFDGHPQTRWARNLAQNPAITVHLESGEEVVILEGTVEEIPSMERERAELLSAASQAKYDYTPGVEEYMKRGLFALSPTKVIAWGESLKGMTRWRFDREP